MYIPTVALSMEASKSFARRRLRFSHAMVRSTTQRRGSSCNPLAASERLMIWMIQSPSRTRVCFNLSPA